MGKDTIYRQDAIDAFKKELTVGESKGNYVTICSAIGYEGAKQILESLPPARTEVTEEVVNDYCRKRSLTILTNDYFHKLTSAQTKADKDIVYKEDVLKLIRMMPSEEGITRALLIQSVEQLQAAEFMNEEIIHCPACKYGKGPYHNVRCTKYYGMGGPDDYCSMAERKEAIWQKKDLGAVEYTGVCSNCGYGSFCSEVKNYILCPNCGAKMKVEETNE
jgi:hypothetical protein